MRRDTIGKYGVGAKLAALNFAERIDVWSRTDEESEWLHVSFDLKAALDLEKKNGTPPSKTRTASRSLTLRSAESRWGMAGSKAMMGIEKRMTATSAVASGDAPMARMVSAKPAQTKTTMESTM